MPEPSRQATALYEFQRCLIRIAALQYARKDRQYGLTCMRKNKTARGNAAGG
jgi:hypothetical protein